MISPLLCLVVLPIAGAILIIAGTQARNTAVVASMLNFLASLIIFGMCQPTEATSSLALIRWFRPWAFTSRWERMD